MEVRRVYQDAAGFAGVGYVRVETMVKHFPITIDLEFDQFDGLDTRYVLILNDQLPVATCRLHLFDDHAKIERVSVIPEWSRKGLGSQLLKEAEQWLLELGISHVVITSREDALPFYLKNGYKQMDHEKEGSGAFVCVYVDKNLKGE